MEIFASWAGEASKDVALALREWIPHVLQDVRVFVSSEDIGKGRRWSTQLAERLEGCSFGIVCATPASLRSEWLHFEAGALAKSVPGSLEDNRVVPLLVGTTVADLTDVLAQFQVVTCTEEGIHGLLREVNGLATSLEPARFEAAFERWWPLLAEQLPELVARAKEEAPAAEVATQIHGSRPDLVDLAEEVRLTSARTDRALARIERALVERTDPYGGIARAAQRRLMSEEQPMPGEDMGVPFDALARALASVGSHLRSVSYSPDRIRAGVDSLPRPRDLLILQDLLVPSTRLALVLFDESGNTVETTLPGPGEERP